MFPPERKHPGVRFILCRVAVIARFSLSLMRGSALRALVRPFQRLRRSSAAGAQWSCTGTITTRSSARCVLSDMRRWIAHLPSDSCRQRTCLAESVHASLVRSIPRKAIHEIAVAAPGLISRRRSSPVNHFICLFEIGFLCLVPLDGLSLKKAFFSQLILTAPARSGVLSLIHFRPDSILTRYVPVACDAHSLLSTLSNAYLMSVSGFCSLLPRAPAVKARTAPMYPLFVESAMPPLRAHAVQLRSYRPCCIQRRVR